MNIVCASSVLLGEEAFSSLGEVTILPEKEINAAALSAADMLITRTKTLINEDLLKGSRVRFVGCPVAGTDHMQTDYLDTMRIGWSSAAGCNANSVVEYVISALCHLTRKHALKLEGMTLGVIGVGAIGGLLAKKAEYLGLRVIQNDPPKEAATGSREFVSLEPLLGESDIVSFHTPLTDCGIYATRHLADYLFFEALKPGAIFINASRGEVVDTDSLFLALENGIISKAVLDVWENEPYISGKLLNQVELGTSHIAGYSREGRLNGTWQIYLEACQFFELSPSWSLDTQLPKMSPISIDAKGRTHEEVLIEAVLAAYDVGADDQILRSGHKGNAHASAAHFVESRLNYGPRREFSAYHLHLTNADPDLLKKATGLGFLG